MDADLGGGGVVRTEADAAPRFALDFLSPSHRQRRAFEKVGAMNLGGQRNEVMMAVVRQRERKRLRLHRLLFYRYSDEPPKRSIACVTFDIAAAVTIDVPAAITSSPFFIPSHIPTPTPRRTATMGNWVMCSRHDSGMRFSISSKSASGPFSASVLPNFEAFSLMGKSKSIPAADRSWLSSGVAIVVLS